MSADRSDAAPHNADGELGERVHTTDEAVQRALESLTIQHLISVYCHFVDDGRFDDLVALFTEDGVFALPDQRHEGRRAVKAFLEVVQGPGRRGRHSCTHPIINIDEHGRGASTVTDFVHSVRDGAGGWKVGAIGRYHDQLVRTAEGWQFRERRVVFLGDDS